MYRLSPIFGRYLNAGTIMRDLRDPLLMHNGLHVVIVGTPDAIRAAGHGTSTSAYDVQCAKTRRNAGSHRKFSETHFQQGYAHPNAGTFRHHANAAA